MPEGQDNYYEEDDGGKAPEASVDGVGPTVLAGRMERWERGREARARARGGLDSQPERPD